MDYGLGPENDECKGLIDNGEERGVRHADHGELGQQLQQHKYKAGVTSVDMFATTSDEREDELAAALEKARSDGDSAAGSGGVGGGADDGNGASLGSAGSLEQVDPDATAAANGAPYSPSTDHYDWLQQGWEKHHDGESGNH